MSNTQLSWADVNRRAEALHANIRAVFTGGGAVCVYGVPRGGIFAAQALAKCGHYHLTEQSGVADVIVDDIIDSGATKNLVAQATGGKPFFALVDKQAESLTGWVSFPWERMNKDAGPQDNVRRILQYIGEDPNREGLLETPDRVVRSYAELFSGYGQDPAAVLKTFEDGACDEMVLLKGVEFQSHCEHHMIPFFGQAHIAYIPAGRVVGVSKLVRLLEVYSRRLQIQERLCAQVANALMEHLQPLGAACVLEASHMCMTCRGVRKQHSVMVTSSLKGEFLSKPEVRAEFFSLIKG